jgi:hypothetical protein
MNSHPPLLSHLADAIISAPARSPKMANVAKLPEFRLARFSLCAANRLHKQKLRSPPRIDLLFL